jgi:hypothetical protein
MGKTYTYIYYTINQNLIILPAAAMIREIRRCPMQIFLYLSIPYLQWNNLQEAVAKVANIATELYNLTKKWNRKVDNEAKITTSPPRAQMNSRSSYG